MKAEPWLIVTCPSPSLDPDSRDKARWTKEPVDHDEEFPHLGRIIVRKRANCDIGTQLDLPLTGELATALGTQIPRSLQAIQGDIVEPRQEERVRFDRIDRAVDPDRGYAGLAYPLA